MHSASGVLEVDYADETYDDRAGRQLSRRHLRKVFHGDIEGESTGEFLMAVAPQGSAGVRRNRHRHRRDPRSIRKLRPSSLRDSIRGQRVCADPRPAELGHRRTCGAPRRAHNRGRATGEAFRIN